MYPCLLPLLSCIPDEVLFPQTVKPSAAGKSNSVGAASFFTGSATASSATASAAGSVSVQSAASATSSGAALAMHTQAVASFVEKFTENIFLGLGASLLSAEGARLLLSAQAECMHHGVLRVHAAAAEAPEAALAAVEQLLRAQVLPLLRSVLLAPPAHLLESAQPTADAAHAAPHADAPDEAKQSAASGPRSTSRPAEAWSQHPLATVALLAKCPTGA